MEHLRRLPMVALWVLAVALIVSHPAQGQQFRLGAGFGNSSVNAVAVDPVNGSLVAAGYYSGYTIFGDSGVQSDDGAQDIFVVWIDSSGQTVVQTVSGGGALDEAAAVAVDTSGNCYVTGRFSGSATFGSTGGVQQTLSTGSLSVNDVFLAKYSGDGTFLWAVQAGATGDAASKGICVDAQGNVYLVGRFSGQIFTSASADTNTLFDAFIASYSSAGALRWAKTLAVQGDAVANDIVATGTSVYVTGSFGGTSNLGSTTGSAYHMFLAEYQAGTGVLLDSVDVSSTVAGEGKAICMDGSGALYVAGSFIGGLDFGDAVLTGTGTSEPDMFLAKYDNAGTLVYARKAGGAGSDFATDVALDIAGNVYISGGFSDGAVFGEDPQNVALSSIGQQDLFVAAYNVSGVLAGVTKAGSPGQDMASGLAYVANGEFVVAAHLATAADLRFSGTAGYDVTLNALAIPAPVVGVPGDISRNGVIGIEDAIGIIQIVSGMRP